MFKPLPARFDFPAAEKRTLEFWEREDVFAQSIELRRSSPRFVFYEGPPTANGMPHPGHCLTRAMKDIFPRYKTMCGFLVERKAGWDTHGLPVEREVCKELGIRTKQEIEAYGVEKFNLKCIQSVFRYTREWEELTRRLGFWVNLQEAYITFHQSYVESVWWSLKTLFDRGVLYQGHKVVWWWAQGGTALSSGEVGEGYRKVDDPSVFVKFPLERPATAPGQVVQSTERRVSLLVWTTTPWTLISNHFAAVHPTLEYALVHDPVDDEYLYIAAALVETIAKKVKRQLAVVRTSMGNELVGLPYTPPFDNYFSSMHETKAELKRGGRDLIGWRVLAADFVTTDSGTGVVHEAPAFGEVDFDLLQAERARFVDLNELGGAVVQPIPVLCAVNPDGTFNDDAPERYRGRWVKDCDKEIIRELRDERMTPWGTPLLYHQEQYHHDYPFCPQAPDDPLIQYARRSWFVRTSQFKDEFLKNNAAINWLPEHIREGRFGNFLRENVDWALSRERYWGTPLPIWKCERCKRMEAIGSFAELQAKPGATDGGYWERKVAEHRGEEFPEHLRVHKPYIDEWTYECAACAATGSGEQGAGSGTERRRDGGTKEQGKAGAGSARMHRVPEVIDCWWDAGSMPFAQWGYPHAPGSRDLVRERWPADFISEAQDQTRGWFYGLLAISTLLRGELSSTAFQAVGEIAAARAAPDDTSPSAPHGASASGAAARAHARTESGARSANQPEVRSTLSVRRRTLPHWESGGSTYFVTFRVESGELSPAERSIVMDACRHFDGDRVDVHATVVLPDHVHVLWTPRQKAPGTWWSLAELVQSVKRFTANEIKKRRLASGQVWQREYFDRLIRDFDEFKEKWNYVVTNPERRGLPFEYPWLWIEEALDERGRRVEGQTGSADRLEGGATDRLEGGPTGRCVVGYPVPYRNVICLGLIAGEDGEKMSKKLRNYKEPTYIFDSYGADAMRWYFFSAQAPWTSVRFQEAAIRDSQREFLVKLYNVLSFFTIYASIDAFDPRLVVDAKLCPADGFNARGDVSSLPTRSSSAPSAGACVSPSPPPPTETRPMNWRPSAERTELDRWIITELRQTVGRVRESMDRFENYPAAQHLNNFVDALSNWYVRRSRDRFWRAAAPFGSTAVAADQEKWDAYHTLYGCLRVLSRLIAPFTPFFAEEMHQVLRIPSDPISVHLCTYPKPEEIRFCDEGLAATMDTVRELVALGRAARTSAKLKVRQPLSLVEIILAPAVDADTVLSHANLIAEELNVTRVELAPEADKYVTYKVVPNFKAIGAKFRDLVPKIKEALGQLADPAGAKRVLAETGSLPLEIEGRAVPLTPDEVEIRVEARPGWSAAQGRVGVVVLNTTVTPELRDEGVVRELIHFVQAARKEQNLAYEARIALTIDAPAAFAEIVRRFEHELRSECLAEQIEYSPATGVEPVDVEGHAVRFAIRVLR